VHTLFLDIAAWGRVAEATGVLQAHDMVLVEGKAARAKRTKKGTTEIYWTTVI
jgi:hypothetical protein